METLLETKVWNPNDRTIERWEIAELLGAFQTLQSFGIDVNSLLDCDARRKQQVENDEIDSN